MMSEHDQGIQTIVLAALSRTGQERQAYLDGACLNDPQLRQKVESLIEQAEAPVSDEAQVHAKATVVDDVAARGTGQSVAGKGHPKQIAHFKIRRVIGSGGMGTVYEGIQETPRRKVAVKVMRNGVTSRSAMRRFSFEAQILARLHHQGIAQIHEAGTWDDGTGGVPWFAMEYIAGAKTLQEYAQEKKLTTRERLELFIKVCDAVSHGHQKGIIHRDLKPGNILVDHHGQPKVIDFGVARATDSDMAVTTLQTDVGQLIGTVQYMSPEQCEADPDILDTRSDVYSLGVILYELLCDEPPYDLSTVPVYEAARVIREKPLSRPSTINKALRGDIETIVMKALEKDRDRRYQSAHELQRDIENYLGDRPIEARPPSIAYQLQVFARRHRALVVSAAAIVIVLIIATVVSIILAVNATRSAGEARAANAEAEVANAQLSGALAKVTKAEEEARRSLDIANEQRSIAQDHFAKLTAAVGNLEAARDEALENIQMLSRMVDLTIELLSMGAPRNAQGRDMTIKDILKHAASEIDSRFGDMPHLEAPARRATGELLWEIGELELAREQLERAIALFNSFDGQKARNREKFETAASYARVLRDLGAFEDARGIATFIIDNGVDEVPSTAHIYAGAKEVLADVIESTTATGTISLRREVIEKLKTSSRELPLATHLRAKSKLAGALIIDHSLIGSTRETDSLNEAAVIIEEVLPLAEAELGQLHPVTLDIRQQQGHLYFHKQDSVRALELHSQVLDDSRVLYDPGNIKIANAATAVAMVEMMSGGNDSTEALFTEAIDIYETTVGEQYPAAYNARTFLANLMTAQERHDEAEPLLRSVFDVMSERHGRNSMQAANVKATLAVSLLIQGKLEEGVPLWHESVDQIKSFIQDENSIAVLQMRNILVISYIIHRPEEADVLADALMADSIEAYGIGHNVPLSYMAAAVKTYSEEEYLQRAVTVLERYLAHPDAETQITEETQINLNAWLAELYYDMGELDRSEGILRATITRAEALWGPFHEKPINGKSKLAIIMADRGEVDDALAMSHDLLMRAREHLGNDAPDVLVFEGKFMGLASDHQRWDLGDAVMDHRLERWQDDPAQLTRFAEIILDSIFRDYQTRYTGHALRAAQRLVELRGLEDPQAASLLARSYLLDGDHVQAIAWSSRAILSAGEGHEEMEAYETILMSAQDAMDSMTTVNIQEEPAPDPVTVEAGP